MKKLLSTMGMAALLLTIACNRPDQKLIEDMKAELDAINNTETQIKTLEQPVGDLTAKSANLVVAKPDEPSNPGTETLMRATAMSQKYQAMSAQLADMKTKLQTLIADYSDGKLRKIDVDAEFKNIQNGASGYPKSMDRVVQLATETAAKVDQLVADGTLRPAKEGETPFMASIPNGSMPIRPDAPGQKNSVPNAAPGAISPATAKQQAQDKQQ